MIVSFADKSTEILFQGKACRKLPINLQRIALRKLVQIHVGADLDFIRLPPGNRFELLFGKRSGQHSIRINDQWRICFIWKDGNAYQVKIVDYH